jgi:release factor glutamine methyltransferase
VTAVRGASPPELSSDGGRSRLVASIAARLGSEREANWIVDHGGSERAEALTVRREAGEPLQYVLGRWPFRSVELGVDPRVLIPRPETEQMVGLALEELGRVCRAPRGGRSDEATTGNRGGHRVCVDLGTGSGAIALSLAKEGGGAVVPDLEIWATDFSVAALVVAQENLEDLAAIDHAAAARVRLAHGWWFEALPDELLGRIDLVVSNPPYVGESEFPGLHPSVRDWEPREALVAAPGAGGLDGMAAIEAILAGASRWLSGAGTVVVEIDPRQADASAEAARRAGFGQVGTRHDLAGRLRMLVARR